MCVLEAIVSLLTVEAIVITETQTKGVSLFEASREDRNFSERWTFIEVK